MDPYALTDNAWSIELGRRLDRLREDRKISREELGEEMGVSQPTIRRLLDDGQGKISNLIAALRVLEALDQLESFLEAPPENPALLLKARRNTARLRLGSISVSATGHSAPSPQEKAEKDDLGW